jgi:hypothetical protein
VRVKERREYDGMICVSVVDVYEDELNEGECSCGEKEEEKKGESSGL